MDHSPGFLAHVGPVRARVHEVSVADARAAIAADADALLFDVREDHEFAAAHAVGARHLARGVVERDIERLVPDKAAPLYMYCGGGFRSALAAEALGKMGYTNVHSVAGGWRAWEEAGAPIDRTAAIATVHVSDVARVADVLQATGTAVELASDGVSFRISATDGNRVEFRKRPH